MPFDKESEQPMVQDNQPLPSAKVALSMRPIEQVPVLSDPASPYKAPAGSWRGGLVFSWEDDLSMPEPQMRATTATMTPPTIMFPEAPLPPKYLSNALDFASSMIFDQTVWMNNADIANDERLTDVEWLQNQVLAILGPVKSNGLFAVAEPLEDDAALHIAYWQGVFRSVDLALANPSADLMNLLDAKFADLSEGYISNQDQFLGLVRGREALRGIHPVLQYYHRDLPQRKAEAARLQQEQDTIATIRTIIDNAEPKNVVLPGQNKKLQALLEAYMPIAINDYQQRTGPQNRKELFARQKEQKNTVMARVHAIAAALNPSTAHAFLNGLNEFRGRGAEARINDRSLYDALESLSENPVTPNVRDALQSYVQQRKGPGMVSTMIAAVKTAGAGFFAAKKRNTSPRYKSNASLSQMTAGMRLTDIDAATGEQPSLFPDMDIHSGGPRFAAAASLASVVDTAVHPDQISFNFDAPESATETEFSLPAFHAASPVSDIDHQDIADAEFVDLPKAANDGVGYDGAATIIDDSLLMPRQPTQTGTALAVIQKPANEDHFVQVLPDTRHPIMQRLFPVLATGAAAAFALSLVGAGLENNAQKQAPAPAPAAASANSGAKQISTPPQAQPAPVIVAKTAPATVAVHAAETPQKTNVVQFAAATRVVVQEQALEDTDTMSNALNKLMNMEAYNVQKAEVLMRVQNGASTYEAVSAVAPELVSAPAPRLG